MNISLKIEMMDTLKKTLDEGRLHIPDTRLIARTELIQAALTASLYRPRTFDDKKQLLLAGCPDETVDVILWLSALEAKTKHGVSDSKSTSDKCRRRP
jgi:hypothetical protein